MNMHDSVRVVARAAAIGLVVAFAPHPSWAAAEPVSYVTGGVGAEDFARLKGLEQEYSLKLVFTLNEGNYLSDVGVVITDSTGRDVLKATADGPVFMAKLPPGAYTVVATYNGKAVTHGISVSGKGLHTDYFRWPANPATDTAISRWTKE